MATSTIEELIERGRESLKRAEVAAQQFSHYDVHTVSGIVKAVAAEAEAHAERLGIAAARETGFGVAEDKVTKNLAVARGFLAEYGEMDYCSHRVDAARRLLMVPKPAGVVFAVLPSTGPVAALYVKALCALLTRNAILLSPHPAAVRTGIDAAGVLASAAERAGAPKDAIQILPEPTIPLVEAMMGDERTKLVLATGGGAVVKAAYRSGTPAIGVGPGNTPVLVDETADVAEAAKRIVDSKTFDNSILCTAESVLLAVASVANHLETELKRNGAHICDSTETQRVRDLVYPNGRFDTKVVGRSAMDLARAARVRVPPGTRLLVTPIHRVTVDEPLTHEKLCPVLALRPVLDFSEAVREAQAVLDVVGIGHSAVLHSNDPQRVLDFAEALPVHRVSVNVPGSLGNAGIGTGLPLTMSVGPGFSGGSSSGDNLNPEHFVQWARTAYSSDANVPFPEFTNLRANVDIGSAHAAKSLPLSSSQMQDLIREDLRRIILEELRDLVGTR